MSPVDYISNYWGLLLIVLSLVLLLRINAFMKKDQKKKFYKMLLLLLTLSVVSHIEVGLGRETEYSEWRAVFTMLKYSISPVILALTIELVYPGIRKIVYIPAAINMLFCIISIKTGIVFKFLKEYNSFQRGPLGYLPFFICGFYIVLFIVLNIISKERNKRDERMVVYIMALSATAILLMPLILSDKFNESWFPLTAAIDTMVYYIFILHQLTQRDALTGLLNRQSYYFMLEHYGEDITAVIAIDMNGLKELNDNYGHEAGDKALAAIGACILKPVSESVRAFRVGGDEFMVLCMDTKSAKVNAVMQEIMDELAKTEYNCAFGCSSGDGKKNVDELIREADAKMYADKDRYYSEFGERKLHK